jgi:hypothetical protein
MYSDTRPYGLMWEWIRHLSQWNVLAISFAFFHGNDGIEPEIERGYCWVCCC